VGLVIGIIIVVVLVLLAIFVIAGYNGLVRARNAHTLALRTDKGTYRFMRGFFGPAIAAHNIFEGDESEQDWQSFLDTTLGEQS